MEYQTENNIKKTEMITILNECAYEKENPEVNHVTEIKKENSSFNSTCIYSDNNHIEFESVLIKMEQEDQYFEENVEDSFDRPLINKDEITSAISQNDIHLTASAILEENINQDYKEHFCEKIDNILKARDSIDDNMQIKVEENYDYSLYSEKCANDPLVNQDEIKIDIVNNDIKSGNGERNNECKIENIEEVSKEHVIPLEYEDKTDKEIKFFHKIVKVNQKETSLSKNIKQKKCDVIQKDKILKTHECSICKKNFSQSFHLKLHMKIHTGKKLHECDVCQKKFSMSCNLREHLKIHTGEKPYTCDVCQKKFKRSSELKIHMRIHSGEKPHECNVCQKKFNQLSPLKTHMRMHTGEKPHECDVCQRKFIQLTNLLSHKRIHTGEKPYECDICRKKFTQLSDRRMHMRIHTGEKPHTCDVCQKKFKRSSDLKIHTRIHTGEKPHECEICQKKFSQSSSLMSHKKIHTREKAHINAHCT